jgi:hypothetical protein
MTEGGQVLAFADSFPYFSEQSIAFFGIHGHVGIELTLFNSAGLELKVPFEIRPIKRRLPVLNEKRFICLIVDGIIGFLDYHSHKPRHVTEMVPPSDG